MVKAGELRPEILNKNRPTGPDVWILGCFATNNFGVGTDNKLWNDIELCMKIAVSLIMDAMINNPSYVVVSPAPQSVLERSKGKNQRFRTVRLSEVGKRYINENSGHSGVKMPEHEVRGHWRRLRSGHTVFVRAHKRGDPSIPYRATPVRVLP